VPGTSQEAGIALSQPWDTWIESGQTPILREVSY
jgi:hypothetical protein